jgi:tetratricopeptide repeat protein 30
MRREYELDLITLHNTALVAIDEDPPWQETFRNLLLGYCKSEYCSYTSDLLAGHTELAIKTMGQPTLDSLDAILLCATSKDDAYCEFEELCKSKRTFCGV